MSIHPIKPMQMLLLMIMSINIGACTPSPIQANTQRPLENITESKAGAAVSVHGVLQYFPPSIKSTEAWLGHEYRIGNTPIKPTQNIPPEVLQAQVGEIVTIEGIWNPGKKWIPNKEESLAQNPVFPDHQTVIRGAGIEALTIKTSKDISKPPKNSHP